MKLSDGDRSDIRIGRLRGLIDAMRTARQKERALDAMLHCLLHPEYLMGQPAGMVYRDCEPHSYQPAPAYMSDLNKAIGIIPDGWFLWHLGEQTTPISRVGDRHNHVGWQASVQHRKGGHLQQVHDAVDAAAAVVLVALLAMICEEEYPSIRAAGRRK